MLKTSWMKKLIVMILIFTLTFADFALVGQSFAASIFNFRRDDDGTGSKNVEFDASFVVTEINDDEEDLEEASLTDDEASNEVVEAEEKEEEQEETIAEAEAEEKTEEEVKDETKEVLTKDVIADVNTKSLSLSLSVSVKDAGYLKDAKISLGDNLNFTFDEESLNVKGVQKYENGEIELVQLNADSSIEILIPIEYEGKDYVQESDISNENKIKFSGTYVDDDKELDVSKEESLNLDWQDNRVLKTTSDVTKFITYNIDEKNGVILEVSVKLNAETDLNTLPEKETKIEISVPTIDGKVPSTIKVVANKLLETTGEAEGEVALDSKNCSYDEKVNTLTITNENLVKEVNVNEDEDVLKSEDEELIDAYYALSGEDEYLITYIYDDVNIDEEEVKTSISSTYAMYGGTELRDELDTVYSLTEEIGDIVTFNEELNVDSISKAYSYLNYNESKYEVELERKLIFDISYKDIVESLYYEDSTNYYVLENGSYIPQNDIYTKGIKVDKDNFMEVLGEDGVITILDKADKELGKIDSTVKWDEDSEYFLEIDNTNGIKIKTTEPISEGRLVITKVDAYKDVSISKEDLKSAEKIIVNGTGKAVYTNLDALVDAGKSTNEIILNDTITNANLTLDRDSFSTLCTNEDVELKIMLNNEKDTSDAYGASTFYIEMPEYVTGINIKDSSIVYGEGLTLDNIESYTQDGKYIIKISLGGTQKALSSGIVSNGTNIVLSMDVTVDQFTPAVSSTIKMTYTNNEATTYEVAENGKGANKFDITFSAPSGVVTVNRISGYNEENDSILSINQGKVTGTLNLYGKSNNATMDIIVMNNEKSDISNVSILGRTVFEGNKDILTGDTLGTTFDTPMSSLITGDEGFTIYYSENEDATKDLEDKENGWTTSVNDLTKIKSYLIVPSDENYILEQSKRIEFTYNFTIPGDLLHNEYLYGTVVTYYTTNIGETSQDEVSVADIVELTTGIGPDIKATSKIIDDQVSEFEEFKFQVTVENTGDVEAENVIVSFSLPNDAIEYSTSEGTTDDYEVEIEDGKIEYLISTLDVGESYTITTTLYTDELEDVEDDENIELEMNAEVTCDDLGTTIETEEDTIEVEQAEVMVTIDELTDLNYIVWSEGDTVRLGIYVDNLTSEEMTNVIVTMELDEAFTFVKGTILQDDRTRPEVAIYDGSSRTVTWKIDSLDSNSRATLNIYFTVNDMTGSTTLSTIPITASAKADGIDTYTSAALDLYIGRAFIKVTQSTNTTNTYVQEGGLIEYVFTIENTGVVETNVVLEDSVPNGLVVREISYDDEGVITETTMAETDNARTALTVEAGESIDVVVDAYAENLNGASELTVTNIGTVVQEETGKTTTSNSITHIIEGNEEEINMSKGVPSSSSSSGTITKTYSITGIAWIDSNKDGARDDDEELASGMEVMLVNSDISTILGSTMTDSNGEYKFSGLDNGNYIIIFDYDTTLYTVTTYQKSGVVSNVNSDAIATTISEDGETVNVAVTDVVKIEGSSISNIDIGLVEGRKFDLKLDMGVTKITVQNSQGTKTYDYDNETYTKTEISQRYISGSTVYVEYKLKVTNEGDVEGNASSIVDYMPESMTFKSSMNTDWYSGSDGEIYTTSLSGETIAPGESKTVSLVLAKTMTTENTGTVSNTAEIAEDYNVYGLSDYDSTPGNNNQTEDDFARADTIISVGTGGTQAVITLIIITIVLIGTGIIVYRVRKKKNENNVNVDLEGGV